jgi:hypothetical protein
MERFEKIASAGGGVGCWRFRLHPSEQALTFSHQPTQREALPRLLYHLGLGRQKTSQGGK